MIFIVFFLVIWPILWAWVFSDFRDTGFLLKLFSAGVSSFMPAVLLAALFGGVVYFFKSVVEIFVEIFSTTKLEKKLEEERVKKLEEERNKKG